MKKMKKVLIIALLLVGVINSQAQLGNIKNRLKTKVEDKVVEKAENKIDKTADDITTQNNKQEISESKKETTTESNFATSVNTGNSGNEVTNDKKEETLAPVEKSNEVVKVEQTSKGKMIFDTKPFSTDDSGNRTSFTSKEFIYAKLELPESLKTFFKISPKNGEKTCLEYLMVVYNGDKEMGTNSWSIMYVGKNEMEANYLNFDVLPQPEKATTVMSPLKEFDAGLASAPLAGLVDPSIFPKSGKYRIVISIYNKTYNGYGAEKPREEWPISTGEFEFNFNEDDIATLQKNDKQAHSLVKENFRKKVREEADLPESWNMKSSPSGSGYTEQQIKGMIAARYKGSKLNKLVIEPQKGGWVVEKNELDIPKDKYFNQVISIFITDSNNKCFYIEGYVYHTYEGGGKYGPVWIYPENEIQISCDKMK